MKKLDLRLILILALALGVRWVNHQDIVISLQGDASAYIRAAYDFLRGGLMGPTTERPPLFPFLLGMFALVLKIPIEMQIVHTIMNTLFDLGSLLILYRLGKRYFGNAAFVGLSFAALSPLWYAHQSSAITECLSVLLFLMFVDFWSTASRTAPPRRRIGLEIGAGLSVGLLALTRGAFLAFPILIVGGELAFLWFWHWRGRGWVGARARLKLAAIFLAASMALPALWGVRNLQRSGHFVMSQDSSTADLMLWSSIYLPTLDWRLPEHRDKLGESPYVKVLFGMATPEEAAEMLPKMHEEAIAFMREHPVQFVVNFFRKSFRLWVGGWWSPYPYVKVPPYLGVNYIFGFCIPVLVWGLWGYTRRTRRSNKLPGETRLLLATFFGAAFVTSIALPFCVDARYSLPVLVLLSLWMGTGLGVGVEEAKIPALTPRPDA